MRGRIADVDPHRLIPAIGDALQVGIKRRPQLRDEIGERIGTVFVFAAAKTVAAHDDAAAEVRVVRIERSDGAAFIRREQAFQDCAALGVEFAGDLGPRKPVNAGGEIS
ncbi:hypothetical protein ACVWXO_010261 [Bradyrhizobium sp. LM2.7]